MATVFVSAFLRSLVPVDRVEVEGRTVGEVIERLDGLYPGVAAELTEDGDIRPGIAVVIDDQVGQLGLFDSLSPTAEVHFLPALSGGAAPPEQATS